MDRDTNFTVNLARYRVEGLDPADSPRVQPLFEACSDYGVLESGSPYGPGAAAEEFAATPPGRTTADKFMFGLLGGDGKIVGLIACDRDWPQHGCWWIALMFLDPATRGQGLGRVFLSGFLAWVRAQGAQEVQLAVLAANPSAERFWWAQGFTPLRTTRPRTMGTRRHVLRVMRRRLKLVSRNRAAVSG